MTTLFRYFCVSLFFLFCVSVVLFVVCFLFFFLEFISNLTKKTSSRGHNINMNEFWIFATLSVCLVAVFYSWAQRVAKKIKRNETAYKYSGSGIQKMIAVFSNYYARKALLQKLKIVLGILSPPISVGCEAPECDLVALDGSTCFQLVRDIANVTDVPLILNIGSYN